MNNAFKLFAVAAVMLFVVSFAQTASAWWGHVGYWGGPVWGARAYAYPAYYGYYGYYGGFYGYDACCAPVVDCCAPVATPVVASSVPVATVDPVCDTCGPYATYASYPATYVLGWRPGPIRRLLFGRYRWYAASYYGGYYYTPDCCAPMYDAIQEVPIQDVPAQQNLTPAPSNTDSAPSVVQPEKDGSVSILRGNPYHSVNFTMKEATQEDSGIVTITVPQDAVVFVNDVRTTATGSSRSFVSFGLTAGNEYDYVIRAEVTRNGRKFVETQVVTLTAGERDSVSFSFSQLNAADMLVSL